MCKPQYEQHRAPKTSPFLQDLDKFLPKTALDQLILSSVDYATDTDKVLKMRSKRGKARVVIANF